ncbi:unnamed protein product [marine sediment metagenome]|uniref:Uncharacterized protein n=1 Tax=marine sediment metagenome TaxID=412755 RepID=X0V190_9ZZZZ
MANIMNNDLEELDKLAEHIQRQVIITYGRQYTHALIMDMLLATSADTEKAISSACLILEDPRAASVSLFVQVLDEAIELQKRHNEKNT